MKYQVMGFIFVFLVSQIKNIQENVNFISLSYDSEQSAVRWEAS